MLHITECSYKLRQRRRDPQQVEFAAHLLRCRDKIIPLDLFKDPFQIHTVFHLNVYFVFLHLTCA